MKNTKVVAVGKIQNIVTGLKQKGKRIVFTNGCFDILHAGHVSYLKTAKSFGDVLVVGLNSDKSVRMIKGERRPVISEKHRAAVLAGLESTDYIVVFDQATPAVLIEVIVPDILVKGADWNKEEIVGGELVKRMGGRVERVAFEQEISSTEIIEKIGRQFYGVR